MNLTSKSQWQALLYFTIATLLTAWFIGSSPYPIGREQFILSNIVSFSRWGIQIIAALILLHDKRWTFIKNIGFVYLLGSAILLPFNLLNYLGISSDLNFFVVSQLLSVLLMVVYYHRAVTQNELNIIWWIAWIACQITAIILQVTVVFDAI